MKKVIAFGEALVDMLSSRVQGESTGVDEYFTKYAGGAPANVAAAVAKLGGRSYFAGKVGADMFGDFLAAELARAGVRLDYLSRTAAAKTALAFVSLDSSGERSFSFYRGPSADMLFTKNDFNRAWFAEPGIFHFCSNTLTEPSLANVTEYGIEMARKAGWLVSFDVNLRFNLWPEGADLISSVSASLRRSHLVKMSEEEFDYLRGGMGSQAFVDELLGWGVQLLVVTRGEKALHYYFAGEAGQVQPPVVTVVDSTAAGDAFMGGLLYQLSRDQYQPLYARLQGGQQSPSTAAGFQPGIRECLQFGSACGAYTVQRKGAFSALADTEALVSAAYH